MPKLAFNFYKMDPRCGKDLLVFQFPVNLFPDYAKKWLERSTPLLPTFQSGIKCLGNKVSLLFMSGPENKLYH